MQGAYGSILQHVQDKQLTTTVYKACLERVGGKRAAQRSRACPHEGGEAFFDSLSRIAGFLLRCEVTLVHTDYGGLKWTTL
jgi:hypothetical protein